MAEESDIVRPFNDFPFGGRIQINQNINNVVYDGTSVIISGLYFSDGNMHTSSGTPGVVFSATDSRIGDVFLDCNGQRYVITGYDTTVGLDGTTFDGTSPLGTSMRFKALNTDASPFPGYSVPSGAQCAITRGSTFGFSSIHVVSGPLSQSVQESVRNRSIIELAEFLRSIGNLGDVDTTGAASGSILQYDGTDWVIAAAANTVSTTAPLGGIGSVGDPVAIIDGTAKAQTLRYDGTDWQIVNSAFNAIVSTTGGEFSTISAALAANCAHIAVTSDITETTQSVLQQDTTIFVFEGVVINNSPGLDSLFDLNGFNLTILGGTWDWTPLAGAISTFYFADTIIGESNSVLLNNATLRFTTEQSNKYWMDSNLSATGCRIHVAQVENSSMRIIDGRYAQFSNCTFIGLPPFNLTTPFLQVETNGQLQMTNVIVNGASNGTSTMILSNGESHLHNITVNDAGIGFTVEYGEFGTGSNNLTNCNMETGVLNVYNTSTSQVLLQGVNKVGDLQLGGSFVHVGDCREVANINITGNNNIISDCYNVAQLSIGADNILLRNVHADGTIATFACATSDSVIQHSVLPTVSISGNRNRIGDSSLASLNVIGDRCIVSNNYFIGTIDVDDTSNNNILSSNLTSSAITINNSTGTVLVGNSSY